SSASSGPPPAASAVARQRTGRTRLPPPPSAYRTASSRAPISGESSSALRCCSKRRRCSSGVRIGLALRLRERSLDVLRDLGELAEELDRDVRIGSGLEPRPCLLEPLHQLLGPPERFLGAHCRAVSRATRPRIPLTSRPASFDEYRFASRTASSITTSVGTSPRSSS